MALAACNGGGGFGGCGSTLAPIPGGYQGPKRNDALTARVTQAGFDYLNGNFGVVLSAAGQQNPVAVPIPCAASSTGNPVGDDTFFFCDQNQNGSCEPGEGCNVTIEVQQVLLNPVDPGAGAAAQIDGSATVVIHAPDIAIYWPCVFNEPHARCHCSCKWSNPGCCVSVQCDLRTRLWMQSANSGRPNEVLTVPVYFSLDAAQGNILAFEMGAVAGIDDIEGDDLHVDQLRVCGVGLATIANWFRGPIVDAMKGPIRDQVQRALADVRCRSCDAPGACPPGASCEGGKCRIPGGACVPLLLGTEGRLDLASLLGSYGVPGGTALDGYAVAGGRASSASGAHFTAGVIGGVQPQAPALPAPCVADLPAPAPRTEAEPDFGAGPAGHHVAVAVNADFLRQAVWSAHRSGALCLTIGTTQVPLLSTGWLRLLFPSLGLVDDSRDGAEAFVALRPEEPPEVTVGSGAVDAFTGELVEPLLKVSMKDVALDLYAYLDDRFMRLFTLTMDVELPLALAVEGCAVGQQKLVPVLGELDEMISNVRTSNSELLAEDPAELAELIPAALSMLEPALARAVGGFAVPEFNGIGLVVDQVGGLNRRPDGTHEHLGLFARFAPPGPCEQPSGLTGASLVEAPRSPGAWRAGEPLPKAVIAVSAGSSREHAAAYSWRVDGGLWSSWRVGPTLAIAHPALFVAGPHEIEVRALSESGLADARPARVEVVVDGVQLDRGRGPAGSAPSVGCSTAGGQGAVAAIAFLALIRRRR